MRRDPAEAFRGLLLGTAVGDALGLPREGLSPRRAARLFGDPPLRHQFFLGRGMVSDDTEHACMTAQAVLASGGDPHRFTRSLAWRLRLWLLGLPAGIGWATLRSIIKLWLGFGPERSGVFSAGNGPLMRAPVLGLCFADVSLLRRHVRASTRLTHTDPRAEYGAGLVALAARHAIETPPGPEQAPAFFERVRRELKDADVEFLGLLELIERHWERRQTAAELTDALGLKRGVSGYVYHSGFVAVYCWLRRPDDFRAAVEEVIRLGGDTDTTAAVVGALVGAAVGEEGIPAEWVWGLAEWPRSVAWMRTLAGRLAERPASRPLPLFWPALPFRNLLFFLIVLLHVLRRLWP